METSETFTTFLNNLKIGNRDEIVKRRDEITRLLNREFRSLNDSTHYQLMIGSFGRHTAINGVSDLDMLYIMPPSLWSSYNKDSGPVSALSRVRQSLKAHYPQTEIKVNQCIVSIQFTNFRFEVQPVFENSDESFKFPDTYSNTWKIAKPREEIKEISSTDSITGGNLRDLCKMVRAWRNKHGVVMGGLLIDTLAYNYLQSTSDHRSSSVSTYGHMVRDFFSYISKEPYKEYYLAVGSRQQVKVKKSFQHEAKQAYKLCDEAIKIDGSTSAVSKWKELFGRPFPAKPLKRDNLSYDNTEQFIEDCYPVDIRNTVTIDCKVTQNGFMPRQLREMLSRQIPLLPKKTLDFTITSCDVTSPHEVRWKVLNRGKEAERRNEIRGQIIRPNRQNGHRETTRFRGDHYVECYVLVNGVVVARDRIDVPISSS